MECLSAASCRGHRATYSRAACLAQFAAKLVGWHDRGAYCSYTRLEVPLVDGRGQCRTRGPGKMGRGRTASTLSCRTGNRACDEFADDPEHPAELHTRPSRANLSVY